MVEILHNKFEVKVAFFAERFKIIIAESDVQTIVQLMFEHNATVAL